MTIVRATVGQSPELHVDKLVAYLASKNPKAKLNFYGDDFVRFGDMYSVNWVGLFATACHLTNFDPFFVGTQTHTPQYLVKGGTMSRYLDLSRSISEQYKFGEHWLERTFTLGGYSVDGKIVEDIIQEIVSFTELPKEQFPPDGRVVMPEKPKPVPIEEPKPAPINDEGPPFWWKVIKKPASLVLAAILGMFVGQVPILGQYVDQIVKFVILLLEQVLF